MVGLAAIITAILGAGATAYQAHRAAKTARQNTDKTNLANRQMAEYQYSRDQDMWNRQNEYNSPEKQQLRLAAGNLNPNLVYGSGSVAGNTAGSMPQYNAPRQDYAYKPTTDLPGMIAQFQDVQMKSAQTDNIKSQTRLTDQNATNAGVQNSLLKLEEYIKPTRNAKETYEMQDQRIKTLLSGSMVDYQLTAAEQQNRQREIQMAGQQTENLKRNEELIFQRYRNEFAKMGIMNTDNVGFRFMLRMMQQSGLVDDLDGR